MSLDKGTLQAYLDEELSIEEADEVREHLVSCAECQAELDKLRVNETFSGDILSRYHQAHREISVRTDMAWDRFITHPVVSSSNSKQRWLMMMKAHKKVAVAAGLLLAISLSLFFRPVQTIADQILSVFRVEKIQAISISPADIERMSQILQANRGSLTIRNFGDVTVDGNPQSQLLMREEIVNRVPGVVLPETLSGGYALESSTLVSPRRVELKLKLNNINDLLQSLGATKLLPAGLDGKIFEIRVPEIVAARFGHDQNRLMLVETQSPELVAPEGVSTEAIREALLQLPFLPPELVAQLRAVSDWQHTLIIPSYDGNAETVSVAGKSGVYISAAKNMAMMKKFFPDTQVKLKNPAVFEKMGSVLWQSNGKIFILGGNLGKETLVNLAGSIK